MSILVGTASLFPSKVQQLPSTAGKLVTCDCWHPTENPRSSLFAVGLPLCPREADCAIVRRARPMQIA